MMDKRLDMTLHDMVGAPAKTGDLGIELEIEGLHLPVEVEGWTTKWEQSLRGKKGRPVAAEEHAEDTPHEYVLPRPVSLDTALGRLESLEKRLRQKPTEVILSERAGTHVHLNMGTQTFRTLLAFLMLFTAVEPILLRLCGPSRNGNLFCLPTYETGDLPQWVEVAAKYGEFNGRDKYSALNIGCLTSLGSVEVRCFPNSISARQIHQWCKWLIAMREIAAGADNTLIQLLERMETDPHWLIEAVFQGIDLSACAPHNPAVLVAYGVEQSYELWKAAQPAFKPRKKEPARAPVLEAGADDLVEIQDHIDWGPVRPMPGFADQLRAVGRPR